MNGMNIQQEIYNNSILLNYQKIDPVGSIFYYTILYYDIL